MTNKLVVPIIGKHGKILSKTIFTKINGALVFVSYSFLVTIILMIVMSYIFAGRPYKLF